MATSKIIDHVFEDGTKFSGTFEQLQRVAEALGFKLTNLSVIPRGYYLSESKGLVKISSLTDWHIRRALLKVSKEYFASTYAKDDTNKQFLAKYVALTEQPLIQDLYSELENR